MSLTVSIALCTYNGEKFLEDQLNSILGQSRLPDELIVCDDCSTDSTIEILTKFKSNCPFPVTIFKNEVNLKSTKNFQKCISLCKGDIIFLCDQDDYWDSKKVELIEKEFIKQTEAKLVFTNAKVVDKDLSSLGYTVWDTFTVGKAELENLSNNPFKILLNGNLITGATMAFRRNAISLKGIPENWFHDAWISILIAYQYPKGIKYLNEELILYRQHGNNQVGGIKENNNILKVFRRNLNNNKELLDTYLKSAYPLKREIDGISFSNIYNKKLLENKIKHFQNRKNLNNNIFNNLLIILKELTSLRYFHFSNGIMSVFKDLFITR